MAQGFASTNQAQSSILTGNGVPTITPGFIGQIYRNNSNGSLYMASDVQGSYNWAYLGQGASSSFNKDTIPGLVSWYKADDGPGPTTEGTNITSWIDKSDTGNTLINVSGTRAYTSNVQNGLPGIRFSGGYIDGVNLSDIAQPNTLFVVFKPTNWGTGDYQCICDFGQGATDVSFWKKNGNTNSRIFNGAELVGESVANNTTTIGTAIANTTSSSVQVNNGSPTVGNSGINVNSNRPLIGGSYTGGYNFTGYVFELLVFTGALSEANQEIVRTYLNNKWGVY